ncbi:MAG: DUF302 domain-containing protein [Actinomycetota bacterium]|nr:DUF302 domain-containing protein [Actinomycetota bacterium]
MNYARRVTVDMGQDEAVEATRAALAEQGFGILTEIDVAATLAAKLGRTMEPYLILGACNPALAAQALDIDPEIGLLLPCNVVVRREGGATIVAALDPRVMVEVPGRPELAPIADEATRRLDAALAGLAGTGG